MKRCMAPRVEERQRLISSFIYKKINYLTIGQKSGIINTYVRLINVDFLPDLMSFKVLNRSAYAYICVLPVKYRYR